MSSGRVSSPTTVRPADRCDEVVAVRRRARVCRAPARSRGRSRLGGTRVSPGVFVLVEPYKAPRFRVAELAVRWLSRLSLERPEVTLADLREAAGALAELRSACARAARADLGRRTRLRQPRRRASRVPL
jgi:hypothetical protein